MKHLGMTIISLTSLMILIASCGESTSRGRYIAATPAAPILVAGELEDSAAVELPAHPAEGSASETLASAEPSQPSAAGAPPAAAVHEREHAAAAPAAATGDLEVLQLVMAYGVERHQPIGAADSFPEDNPPLFAYMQVANGSAEDRVVVITYQHSSGVEVGPARLRIPAGSRGWRTFTRTAWVTHPGAWTVTVSTPEGAQLGQSEFTIGS